MYNINPFILVGHGSIVLQTVTIARVLSKLSPTNEVLGSIILFKGGDKINVPESAVEIYNQIHKEGMK